MIIGIDASRASATQRTGTEAYAYQLIQALIPVAGERGHRLRLYLNAPTPVETFTHAAHVELCPIPQRRLWTHSRLNAELQRRPPDVFFTPAHVIPVAYGGASVATVHDLGYEFFPQAHTRGQLAYLRWSTRHNCRRARPIIADSKATRDDLVRLYNVSTERVTVVYPGADSDLHPVQDAQALDEVRDAYGIRAPYLLYLGTLQPRKNLVRLVSAFAASGLAHQGYSLVLAGKTGWLAEPVLDAIAGLDGITSAAIRLPGYVAETHKAALLSGAAALTFPSLYEGFGFPVLEAQACGLPVMCSNTSSLPEVAGNGALLVDPLDTDGMAAALVSVAGDQDLRTRLVANGFANLSRFNWQETAAAVLQALESAIET